MVAGVMRVGMREVSAMLAARMEPLVSEILPAAKRSGDESQVGSVGGEPGKSLSIKLRGAKAGRWADFAGGPSGDPLDLIAHVLFRGEVWPAFMWSKRWLGIEDGPLRQPPAVAAAPKPPEADRPNARQQRERARRIWCQSVDPAGSIIEPYLLTRGGSRIPKHQASIRFHADCPHGPGRRYPAMVCLMTDALTGQPVGIHRTPLLPDGSGRPPGVAKKTLGLDKECAVIRLTEDCAVTQGLSIAEGIETALSVSQRYGWDPVWAAGNAHLMGQFPPMPGVEAITIFADHDIAGIDAAQHCARQWIASGREATILTPLSHNDWNDAACEVAA